MDPAAKITEFVSHTDGFVAKDYRRVLHRAHEFALADEVTLINDVHLENALDGYVSINVDRAGATISTSNQEKLVNWTSVGAMDQAKQVLRETLEWPTKYPEIFAKIALKLFTGVLLYGYPGTGKSLAAKAAATEAGLPLITVKGPELFSKYIGESEAGVRSLFNRARAAAPCVVFLDELDAIAPKRGSDSAGAADRVVNQLLTELDGVDELAQNVYILAATSRPDLVDPALLRPGRIDRAVLCDMPDAKERLEIISVALKQSDLASTGAIKFSDSIDWESVAERTEGLTGADLQAVVYTAYLNAFQQSLPRQQTLSNPGGEKHDNNLLEYQSDPVRSNLEVQQILEDYQIEYTEGDPDRCNNIKQPQDNENGPTHIEMHHINSALLETRPSIQPDLKSKLQRIYQNFRSGKSTATQHQKVTQV
jgi:peroxin-1